MTQWTIQPLAHVHRKAAAQTLTGAFMDDPLFNYIVPNSQERRRWLPHVTAEIIRRTRRVRTSHAALENGHVIGVNCSAAYPPSFLHKLTMTLRTVLLPRPWEPAITPLLKIGEYEKHWEQMHYTPDHTFVYMIGVAPSHQGKGVGKALMNALIEQTNPQNQPIYLETQTAGNVPFYQGLGFTVTEQRHPCEDGPPTWGMLRQPT